MKKYYFILLLFMFYAANIFAANPYDAIAEKLLKSIDEPSAAIAVMPFDSGSDSAAGDSVANEIISALNSQGAVVVERRSMDKILEELSLQQTGLINDATVAKVGKSLGAKYIVTGSAKEFNRPGYKNVGLKVQARLVDVESGKILSSANTEVEKSDVTEPYKRREAAGPLRYPAMLGLTFGLNIFENYFDDYDFDYNGVDSSSTLSGSGFELGIQYFPEKKNFFGSLWEMYYYQGVYGDDSSDWDMKGGALTYNIILRIPLWRYIDFMPFLTHVYLGPGFGYGYYQFSKENDDSEIKMNRFFINVKAGVVIGLSDSILLGVQYTYNPDSVAGGFYSLKTADGSSESGQAEIKDHEIHFSFIFTP
ncbi:MAG: hypothetical protein JW982_00135 [Spirochaetes bacterium]|nr:hypothetical protein [Spirochaetota bacterium]